MKRDITTIVANVLNFYVKFTIMILSQYPKYTRCCQAIALFLEVKKNVAISQLSWPKIINDSDIIVISIEIKYKLDFYDYILIVIDIMKCIYRNNLTM